MLHGATLYEEETRAALVIRMPDGEYAKTVVKEPVQLLDVAPTILGLCDVAAPDSFQGRDLMPLIEGMPIPATTIHSETKAVMEGRYLSSSISYPLKITYSVIDGQIELFRLPDEKNDLYGTMDPEHRDYRSAMDLVANARNAVAADFWLIHIIGRGKYEILLDAGDEHRRTRLRSVSDLCSRCPLDGEYA